MSSLLFVKQVFLGSDTFERYLKSPEFSSTTVMLSEAKHLARIQARPSLRSG